MIVFNLISNNNTLGSSFGVKQYGESVKFSPSQKIKSKTKDELQSQEPKTEAQRMQDILKLNAEDNQKASKIGSIDSKLKSGKKLTKEDLEYLKSNMPELYEEAKVTEIERSSYEQKLQNASSKQEVQKIQEEKAVEFSTKVKNIMNNTLLSDDKKYKLMMQVHSSLAGISEAHNDFINSGNLSNLPEENDLEEEINNDIDLALDLNLKEDINQDINQDININTSQEKLNINNIQQNIKNATSFLSKRLILKGE